MTDEQIRQNAEAYATHYDVIGTPIFERTEIDAFIAGAHSRDVEIAYLTYRLNDAAEKLQTVIAERDNLRNPWRDAKEELPPKFIDDAGEEYEQSIPVAVRTKNSNHWHMAEYYYDTKEWLCEENNTYIIRDDVTHWMPIPELK